MNRHRAPIAKATIGLLLAGALAVVIIALSAGGTPHTITVTVPQAVGVVAGQEIRLSGVPVGSVQQVSVADRGRAARLTLNLDGRAWPLHAGSRMRLRWGGTVDYDNRYIALTPSRTGPMIRDGGRLPSSQFVIPQELQTVVSTFDGPTRQGIKHLLDNAGASLPPAAAGLRDTLSAAPRPVGEVNDLLTDLDGNERALGTLVSTTDTVINAVQQSRPGLADLVSASAGTLSATAAQATNIKASLDLAPSTLDQATRTLATAAPTLTMAAGTLQRLAPGIGQLRLLTPPLRDALSTIVQVTPDAHQTLQNLYALAPRLNPLLDQLIKRMPQLGSIGRETGQQLLCIRPYTPDIVSWFTDWGGFMSSTDGVDRYLRANVEVPTSIPLNVNAESPAQLIKDNPATTYAFPRPPGYNAGQPWFLPQCGAGRDALNPAMDPEYRHYEQVHSGSSN